MLNTLTTVGVWNGNIFYPAALIPILPKLSSQTKVSTILLLLLAQEWKKRQTNYPQYFDYSGSMYTQTKYCNPRCACAPRVHHNAIVSKGTSNAADASDLLGNHVVDVVTLPLSGHDHLRPIASEMGSRDREILHVDTLQFLVRLSIHLLGMEKKETVLVPVIYQIGIVWGPLSS